MVKSGWVLAVPHFLFYLFSIDVRSSGRSKDIFFPPAVSNCWYLIIHAIMGKLLLSGDLFLPCIYRWTYKKHSFSHLDLDVLSAAPIVNSWNYRCDYPNFCLNVLFGYWNISVTWSIFDRLMTGSVLNSPQHESYCRILHCQLIGSLDSHLLFEAVQ